MHATLPLLEVTAFPAIRRRTVETLHVSGAIFGLVWGTLMVSFASSAGATLAFLASRFLFRDAVQARFGDRLRAVNSGVEREGAFYLFALRLVPVFPFLVVNLVVGLTPLHTWTFYWVSQAGMFASTVVFVNAGTQIARLESPSGILSPGPSSSRTPPHIRLGMLRSTRCLAG